MPPVKKKTTVAKKPAPRRKKAAAAPPPPPPQNFNGEFRLSHLFFGLIFVAVVIVGGGALLGGSTSDLSTRFAGTLDGAARTMGVSVRQVDVVGLERDPDLARGIAAAAMIAPGENMFRADPHAIRRRVLASGQVGQARVYRLWPDQVIIRVVPAEPVALWHDGTRWMVVDTMGRTMPGLSSDDYTGLMHVAGEGAAEAVPDLVNALLDQPALARKIAYALRVSERRWDLTLRTGVSAQMPGDELLKKAVDRLADVEERANLSNRKLETIDLRVPDRMILKPADETTGEGQ